MVKNEEGKAWAELSQPTEENSPFVLFVDGMMGKEYQVVLADLSQLMDAKMEEPTSHVKGWVNGWITIAVTRSYSRAILIARVPSPLQTRYLDWDLGLGLAQ